MVVIMRLAAQQEWKMIPRMVVKDDKVHRGNPEPTRDHVTAQKQETTENRQEITENMFHGMTINRCHGNRITPLVMHFVEPLVEQSMMQDSVDVVEADLLANDEN